MADLKKVMEKLNSQKSTKEEAAPAVKAKLPVLPKKTMTPKVAKKAVEEEDLVENDDEDLDEEQDEDQEEETETEESEEAEEAPEATEAVDPEKAITQEIERLQNNGVFRAELLYQLIGINENLKVLNHLILKALGGQDGKPTK